MSKHGATKDDQPHLSVIEGGASGDPAANAQENLVNQRFDFLRRLEKAGLNTTFLKRLLLGVPEMSFEEVFAFLQERATENLDDTTIELFKHSAALASSIFLVHTAILELAEKPEGQPEAEATKKQIQLKILDEEMLTAEEEALLLTLLDQDTPQLEGLDISDPQAIAEFRAELAQEEIQKVEFESNVLPFEPLTKRK